MMKLHKEIAGMVVLLKTAGMKQFIGGLDVSANEDERGRFQPHFQSHSWGFMSLGAKDRIAPILRGLLPKTDAVVRPLVFRSFDGRAQAYRYAFRSSFDRRVTYEVTDSDGSKKRRTRKRELRAKQEVALAIKLNSLGLARRIILIGWRVNHDGAVPRLIKIKVRSV